MVSRRRKARVGLWFTQLCTIPVFSLSTSMRFFLGFIEGSFILTPALVVSMGHCECCSSAGVELDFWNRHP